MQERLPSFPDPPRNCVSTVAGCFLERSLFSDLCEPPLTTRKQHGYAND